MATDKLYKLTDEQSRWVDNKVRVNDGYWVPDPVDENLFGVPGDPIETGRGTSSGGSSGGSNPGGGDDAECEVIAYTVTLGDGSVNSPYREVTMFRCIG